MNYKEWIVRDPKVCNGWPHIKGTNIPLKVVLGHLSLGDSVEEIVKIYPGMPVEGVKAVIAMAATMVDLEIGGGLSRGYEDGSGNLFIAPEVAEIYARQGLFLEAAKIYRNILEKDPTNSEIKKKLSDLEKKIDE